MTGNSKMIKRKGKIIELYKLDKRTILSCLGVFVLYLILQLKFLGGAIFDPDEIDIMLGGKTITKGYLLYRDFLSQHMPISYYISAIFHLLGAKTVLSQRIAYYVLFAFSWTSIYIHYQKIVKKSALFLYPICFMCVISCYDWGTVILSEHLAGIGFVILLLEFLAYWNTHKMTMLNYIMLSISVLLTFGTIFIAAFGIFVIAIGFIINEIKWYKKENIKIKDFIKQISIRYSILLGWIILPWLILIIYYESNRVLDDFIFGAYTLNRTIYPKYIMFGGDIFQTVLEIPLNFINTFQMLFKISEFNIVTVIYGFVLIMTIMYFVKIVEKEGVALTAILALFTLSISVRGCFNFHGTQWVEVVSLMSAIVITDTLVIDRKFLKKRNIWYHLLLAVMMITITSQYFRSLSTFVNIKNLMVKSKMCQQIENLTEVNEAIWNCWSLNVDIMNTDRPMIGTGYVPWGWEGYGTASMIKLQQDAPRIIVFDENHVFWDRYAIKEYAPDLVEFIATNYTCMEGMLYVRNDYYDEAKGKLIDLLLLDATY